MLWPGRNLFPYELDILYIADASPSPFSNWVDTSGNSWPCFWSPQSTETSADQIPIHRTHLPIVGGGVRPEKPTLLAKEIQNSLPGSQLLFE